VRVAAAAVRAAEVLVFTSGAGLSVDSGLPDFRGPQGFWRAYPPMKALGLRFEQMSNPRWFTQDPQLAWGFWGHRFSLYRSTLPHSGYDIMLRWGRSKETAVAEDKQGDVSSARFFVFTSNVDGAFSKAGFPPERILECHGSTDWMQCIEPGSCPGNSLWSSASIAVEFDSTTFRAHPPLPTCVHCPRLSRPNVLMFDDDGFADSRLLEQQERFDTFIRALPHECRLVVVEIGAGHAVPTVRMQSQSLVRHHPNATLIRINPTDYDVPSSLQTRSVAIPMGGKAALTAIDELLHTPCRER